MEKYSKWRDPGTGIAPFLPNKLEREYDNIVVQLLWWLKRLIIGPALVILRLPFVIIVFLWLLLFSFLAQLIPVPIIKRLFTKYIQFFGARLLLLLLGFWWIETRNFFISRQKRDSITKVGSPGSTVKNGDIIVANHTSYIDVLYFTFRFSPVFTTVPTYWKESPPQGVVIRRGLVGALLDSISLTSYKAGDANALSEVCKHATSYSEGPVVLFPEGTTTNGKTILAPVPALVTEQSLPRQCKVHVVGLKYECEDFSPSFSVGSFVWHFLRLLAQVHNKLEVRYLSEPDTPTLPLDATDREPTAADRDEWSDAINRSLGAVLQIRKATLNVLDKRDFLQYWFSHKKTYKTK